MTALRPDRLADLAIKALERTAFVLAEPAPAASRFEAACRARVAFTGAAEGSVVLAADRPFLGELASSMLGVDAETISPDTEGRQALRELANIVGGSVIVALGGETTPYRSGLPEDIPSEANAPASTPTAVTGLVASEDGFLEVTWQPVGTAP